MPTTSNFGWTTPADTDLVKDGALAIRTLGNGIDTSLVDLKGGTTGQILSKASNTDLDYTWINNDQGDITSVGVTSPITGGGTSGAVTIAIQDATTAQKGAVQLENSTSSTSTTTAAVPASVKSAYDLANAAIPKSLVDAKGDLLTATADDTITRLAVGTNGQYLSADSTTATGLKWITPSASASGLTFISRTSFSNVASQAFDNVFTSSYFNYLVVIDNIYAATDTDDLQIQFRYAGPSTETGATYYGCAINSKYNTTTVSNANTNGGTSFMLASETSNSVYLATGFFYVGLVGQSSQSPVINGIFYANNTGTSYHFSGGTTNARTYTGFLLKSSSSNITGAVTIYGLAKA